MILHALQGPGFVSYPHDFILIGPTADLIVLRQRALLDDQAVIARGGEGVGHSLINRAAVVVDLIGLAVHQSFRADDFGATDESDALMAQAHAQERQLWTEMADNIVGNPTFAGRAWTWADDDVSGFEILDLIDRDLVVAEDLDLQAGRYFAESLHEVVGEAVVII